MFVSTKQANVMNRTLDMPRAQVTGGCGAHNAMVFTVGSDYDYDEWAEITGERDWRWNNVKNVLLPELLAKMPIRINNDRRVLEDTMKKAILSLGYKHNEDPIHSGSIAGFFARRFSMQWINTTKSWRRVTTYSAFTEPTLKRCPNLDVQKQVVFIYVIGIGDRDKLRRVGVKSILHAPRIGSHLQDHLYVFVIGHPVTDKYSSLQASDFAHNVPIDGFVLNGPANASKIQWSISPDIQPVRGINRFRCPIELVRPTSLGSIHIRSNDPLDRPPVDTNFLATRNDIDILIDGIKACRQVQQMLVKSGHLNDTQDELIPGVRVQSPQDLETYIRMTANEDYHPHGTCRMGHHNDTTSPITGRLLVKGTSNLRVVDASSIPAAPSGI
eukprot:gene13242-15561_t